MIQVKITEVSRDKNNKITGYIIVDKDGKTRGVESSKLKQAIADKKIECINYTLSSDNRLIPHDEKNEFTESNLDDKYNIICDDFSKIAESFGFEVEDYKSSSGTYCKKGLYDKREKILHIKNSNDYIDIIINRGDTEYYFYAEYNLSIGNRFDTCKLNYVTDNIDNNSHVELIKQYLSSIGKLFKLKLLNDDRLYPPEKVIAVGRMWYNYIDKIASIYYCRYNKDRNKLNDDNLSIIEYLTSNIADEINRLGYFDTDNIAFVINTPPNDWIVQGLNMEYLIKHAKSIHTVLKKKVIYRLVEIDDEISELEKIIDHRKNNRYYESEDENLIDNCRHAIEDLNYEKEVLSADYMINSGMTSYY